MNFVEITFIGVDGQTPSLRKRGGPHAPHKQRSDKGKERGQRGSDRPHSPRSDRGQSRGPMSEEQRQAIIRGRNKNKKGNES